MSTISFRGTEYTPVETVEKALLGLCVLIWAFVIYYAWQIPMPRDRFGIIFLCGMMVVFLVSEMVDAVEDSSRFDILLISVSIVVTLITAVYMNIMYDTLINHRLGYALQHEYILGLLFVITLVYLTYRAYGLVFCAVVVSVLYYTYFGWMFPGILRHAGFSWTRLVNVLVWEFQFSGMFGSINQIVAAWVALFLMYAGLLRGYGAFDLILRVAIRAGNLIESGVSQAAITASIIIGSITGSQMANAAITGSFTIPMMKDSGLTGETAGGIESVASSGGQLMPPIMGAAAFVMASILGIGYVNVIIAGLVPAFIFYASAVVAVHYITVNELQGREMVDMREYLDSNLTTAEVWYESIRFLIPFGALIYTLGIARWTVTTAAFWTVVLMLLTGYGFPLAKTFYEDGAGELRAEFRSVTGSTLDGFKYGAVTMAPIAIVVGAINGIVDLLVVSGIPGKIALALLGLSAGILALAVVLAMVVCIILGLGMPTVAAYVIVAFLIAPALTSQFGVTQLAAHYFVFYAAMLSGLTPPIAVAVVVASGIASANFWGTCYKALKISVVLFILPFGFIYNPELTIAEFTVERLWSTVIAFGGAIVVTHGLNYFRKPVESVVANLGIRLVYFVLGFVAIVFPQTELRVGAFVLGALMMVVHRYMVGSRADIPASTATLED